MRAIAFDLDNTLWDVEPVLARAEARLHGWLHENCPRIAQRLSTEDMRRAREELARREPHHAHDLSYLRITALAAHAREHGYHERIASDAFEVFLAARNQLQPFADVAPALARLRQRYRLATLSNGNADLARIGLDEAFTVSLNARQIGAAKPHRSCFERLARELGLAPPAILHVGDDPRLDVEAARAAGFVSAWMNRRARAWPQELAVPEVVVSDCAQLTVLLGV